MIRMKGIRKEYRMGDSVLAALDGVDTVSYTHLTLPTTPYV